MAAWVFILERIIHCIGVPIPRLRILPIRHNAIRGDEAAQHGGVESRAVVVQAAQAALGALAGLCPARV